MRNVQRADVLLGPFRRWSCESPLRMALSVSLGLALFFLAFLPAGVYSIDGNSMLAVSEALVANHNPEVPLGLGLPGRGGHIYSNWYPLLSVVALPLVALAHLVSQILHLPFHYVAALIASVVQVPLTAATAGFVLLLSVQLGATLRGAWLASVSFALGTVAMVYVRTFYAEPLLALLVVASMYYAFRLSPRSIAVCSFLASLAVLAKPSGIFVGLIISAYLVAKRRPLKTAALPGLGSLLGLLLYMAYNIFRFGHALTFGPPWIFNLSHVPFAVAGLIASPGWGVVWYCPPILLSLLGLRIAANKKIFEVSTAIALFLAFLFFHSAYLGWWGGWSWGPRYLVPGIPGLCSFMGLLTGRARKALIALTVISFIASAPTLFSFYERYLAETLQSGITSETELTWSVQKSPLLQAWPAGIRQIEDASHHDVRELFAERGVPSHKISESRALRIVAVWWWVLPIAGIPHWVGFLICVALCSGALIVLVGSFPPTTPFESHELGPGTEEPL